MTAKIKNLIALLIIPHGYHSEVAGEITLNFIETYYS